MPTKTKQAMSSEIESARLLIENAIQDNEIRTALSTVGYSTAILESGRLVVTAAVDAVAAKERIGGGKLGNTDSQQSALQDLKGAYQGCVERARLAAAQQPHLLETLGITGRTPTTVAALILRVETLLKVLAADAGLRALLAERGVDAPRLAELADLLATLKAAETAQEAAKGAAQAATQAQTEALATLAAFVRPLRQAARVACKGRPDLLTKLGV